MSDWEKDLTPSEQVEWDTFVKNVRENTVQKMADSAFCISLVPRDEPDIKFAVELGLAIMLDKPIIAIQMEGADVPQQLRKVADTVIEIDDLDTEAGQLALQRQLAPFLEHLRHDKD